MALPARQQFHELLQEGWTAVPKGKAWKPDNPHPLTAKKAKDG